MKKISKRYYFLIGSLIFGMFFGAGNLIFPIHLGQLAGANWGKAAIGFLLSGVLLPLLSLLAISITRRSDRCLQRQERQPFRLQWVLRLIFRHAIRQSVF